MLLDANTCDLSAFEPHVLTSALKKLLRELPDPLIPSHWYDAFIEASRKIRCNFLFFFMLSTDLIELNKCCCCCCTGTTRDDHCAAQLLRLVQQLPEVHRVTLRALLSHLCRLCQWQHGRGRCEPPTLLTQTFAHIILRPPWERIM